MRSRTDAPRHRDVPRLETVSMWFTGFVVTVVLLAGVVVFRSRLYEVRLLTLAGIYGILAIGLRLTLGELGELNLGHTAFYAAGGYLCALTVKNGGFDPAVGLVVAVVAASVLALAVSSLTIRLSGPYFAVAALGLIPVVTSVLLAFPDTTGGSFGLSGYGGGVTSPLPLIGLTGPRAWLIFVWGLAAVAAGYDHYLRVSRFGRSMNAIRQDSLLFTSLGYRVAGYKVAGVVISGALAGLAGGLIALFEGNISVAAVGLPALLPTLLVIVVGGGTAVPGGVLAMSVVMTMAPEYARSFNEYRLIGFGLFLLVLLRFYPAGLGSFSVRGIDRMVGRWASRRGGGSPVGGVSDLESVAGGDVTS